MGNGDSGSADLLHLQYVRWKNKIQKRNPKYSFSLIEIPSRLLELKIPSMGVNILKKCKFIYLLLLIYLICVSV